MGVTQFHHRILTGFLLTTELIINKWNEGLVILNTGIFFNIYKKIGSLEINQT